MADHRRGTYQVNPNGPWIEDNQGTLKQSMPVTHGVYAILGHAIPERHPIPRIQPDLADIESCQRKWIRSRGL